MLSRLFLHSWICPHCTTDLPSVVCLRVSLFILDVPQATAGRGKTMRISSSRNPSVMGSSSSSELLAWPRPNCWSERNGALIARRSGVNCGTTCHGKKCDRAWSGGLLLVTVGANACKRLVGMNSIGREQRCRDIEAVKHLSEAKRSFLIDCGRLSFKTPWIGRCPLTRRRAGWTFS
jgi:hypothetical protein